MPSKVIFKVGSRAEYDSLPKDQILDNALYFLVDTNELYRGTVPICKAHYYEGLLQPGEDHQDAIARIVADSVPALNDILVLYDDNEAKYPYIYSGRKQGVQWIYGWNSLHGKILGEDVVFSDGESLIDKLNSTSPSANNLTQIDKRAFTIYYDENDIVTGFTLKDFGTRYYQLNERNKYEAVDVNEDNPWLPNLVLQTIVYNGKNILAWAEPRPVDLTELQTKVYNLQTIVGKSGSPSTGLVKRIEDVEAEIVKEIQVGDLVLRPVTNRISLPIFNGKNYGVVPKPGPSTPNDYVLSAAGTWVKASEAKLEWEKY